jgi:hypothetical protein
VYSTRRLGSLVNRHAAAVLWKLVPDDMPHLDRACRYELICFD